MYLVIQFGVNFHSEWLELVRARERRLPAVRKGKQKDDDQELQPTTSENNREVFVKDCIENMSLLS